MCTSAERAYQGGKDAPAAARGFGHSMVVAALLPGGWNLADDVAIVISELVTGAIVAGAPSVRVRVSVHYDHVEVQVSHRDGALVTGAGQHETAVATRRAVLNALTHRMTIEQHEDGHVHAHARLRCDPRFTEKIACRYRPAS